MNKSRPFKTTYTITFKGRSRFFEGDKTTFMEDFIEKTMTSFLFAIINNFKTLKVTFDKKNE